MITLRQMRSVVAVAEEGSFTKAAARENATQSGISQHVSAVEAELGLRVFERASDGVVLTPAGQRYYRRVLDVLRGVDDAMIEAQGVRDRLSGTVRAGIMPVLSRAALAPAIVRMTEQHPDVSVEIIGGYSGALTDMVKAEEMDFAVVPAFGGAIGLTVTHFVRDRELLVAGPQSGLKHGKPVRLADLPPLKLVTPSRNNIRKARIEDYITTHSVRIDRTIEIDAMLGTLDLVAKSDWVTILPGVICAPDQDGKSLQIAAIDQPPLYLDLVHIQTARRSLSPQAKAFLDTLRSEAETLVAT